MNFFIISNDLTVLPAAPIDGGGVVRRRLDEDFAWLKELAGVGLTGDEAKALPQGGKRVLPELPPERVLLLHWRPASPFCQRRNISNF